MAKAIRSRYPARKIHSTRNAGRLRRHTASHAAQIHLLTATLDAAVEGIDSCLPRFAASLSRYSRCRYVGIVFFEEDGIAGCTSWQGHTQMFRHASPEAFSESEIRVCNAILKKKPDSGFRLTESGSFLRNRKEDASTPTNTDHGPLGVCVGSAYGSVALIPIVHQDTAAGFIFIGDERQGRISPAIVTFAERLGAHLASTAASVISADASPKAREEMKLITRLIDNANEPIIISQDWRILCVNNKCAEMAGRSKQDLIGMAFLDMVHPDDRPKARERYSRILNGEWFSSGLVLRGFDRDRNTTWAGIREVPFAWNGRPAIMHMIGDMTDRIRAEEALQRQEQILRTLTENSSDIVVLINPDRSIRYESPAAQRILGFTPEERLGADPMEHIHPADMPMVTDSLSRMMEDPASPIERHEIHLRHKDGSWRTMESVASVIAHGPVVEGVMVNLRDITDHKKAEQALRASEEYFRALLENARDVVTVTDENCRVLYQSPSLQAVTGYAPEEWIGKSLADMQLHPDDLASALSGLETVKRQPSVQFKDISLRYRHRDGSWRVVETSSRNLLQDPRVKGLVFNFRDITVRRRMEEALQESEHRYRLLAENASDVILTVDMKMRLTYVSPSIVQLSGYTPEEARAMDWHAWLAPKSREFVRTAYPAVFSKAKSGQRLTPAQLTVTVELLRKCGGTVWVEIRADFLHDASGQVTGLIGVARDVSDRRAAEAERERLVHLQTLISEISTAFISIPTDDIDDAIHNALASVSKFTEVDRSCVFLLAEDGASLRLSHEWCEGESGFLAGRIDSVRVDSIPWLMVQVRQALCMQLLDVADLPATASEEELLFRTQGMRSAIVLPMVRESDAIGFLALGCTDRGKSWDNETTMALRLVAQIFSNALERKRMDLALRESERRYRLLAENITDVIWTVDMQANITYMSPSAARLIRCSAEDLTKLTVADLLTPDSLERGMTHMAEQMASETLPPKSRPTHWTLEVELRRKDGSTVWAEEQVNFIRSESGKPVGLLGLTRDISRRKAIEEALRVSEWKYRTLVEASPDGVLSINSQGFITDCNTGLCKMLGYETEELRGKDVKQLGTRKDLDGKPNHRFQGDLMEEETEIIRRDGQILPVWVKMVRLAEASAADIQRVFYIRDIADRRKIDEMKDEFIGLVSHELRSPLTVIIGALHTAISEGPRLSQKEVRQLLLDASLEAEQLSHLVGNLLELSRAQANRLFLHVEPVNLARTVRKVIGSIEHQAPKHRFVADVPRKLPLVSADQLRLERILHNLMENAAKYSPEGTDITVSARYEEGYLVVSVCDRGPGISVEDQAKLFKPFQQLGDPMLNHTKGAGLGLLVCRRLVEAHGGRIWVDSEPGHGATFTFTIAAL